VGTDINTSITPVKKMEPCTDPGKTTELSVEELLKVVKDVALRWHHALPRIKEDPSKAELSKLMTWTENCMRHCLTTVSLTQYFV